MMNTAQLKRRLARSRNAPLVAFPLRLQQVVTYNAAVAGRSARWLVTSREHTNFTYDLTDLNRTHLAWFVAAGTDLPVAQVRGYLDELEHDHELRDHIRRSTLASGRAGLADAQVRYGRRAGWYALVRAFRPEHVVETGTDKGLGSCVLAAALLHNGTGRLTTIDVNPEAGYLLDGPYREVTRVRTGDSVRTLSELAEPVDFFLHDSDHSAAHEAAELAAVEPLLSERATVLSDNARVTDELASWAEARGHRFFFFDERPADHWYPGAGIGLALTGRPGAGARSDAG